MVPPSRFELLTPSLGNWCSIQLSYGSGSAAYCGESEIEVVVWPPISRQPTLS